MRSYRLAGAVIGALGLAAVAWGSAAAQQLSIATGPEGSASFNTGSQIAAVLTANGVAAAVAGSADSVNARVSAGAADLGVVSAGEGAFSGPQDYVTVVAALAPLRVAIYVREAAAIEILADLRGRSVTTGFPGNGPLLDVILHAILAGGGLDRDDIVAHPVDNIFVGTLDFAAGVVDAFFFAIGVPPVANAAAAVPGGVRMLPLEISEAAMTRLNAIYPDAYAVTVAPSDPPLGFDTPTPALAYDNVLLANDGLSNDLAGRIARILAENKDALVAQNGAWNLFDPAAMYRELPTPYHPGAAAYYTQ
jgi:hypothetical protein